MLLVVLNIILFIYFGLNFVKGGGGNRPPCPVSAPLVPARPESGAEKRLKFVGVNGHGRRASVRA